MGFENLKHHRSSHASRKSKRRKLRRTESGSGDGEGRQYPVQDTIEDDEETAERTAVITDVAIGKHPGPLPSDGEVCTHFSVVSNNLHLSIPAVHVTLSKHNKHRSQSFHPTGIRASLSK